MLKCPFALSITNSGFRSWFKTLLDVYHPLSSSINTAASQSLDPRGLYHAVHSAVLGSEVKTSTPRRRRSKREMTLESSEREELRSALKSLVVWASFASLLSLFPHLTTDWERITTAHIEGLRTGVRQYAWMDHSSVCAGEDNHPPRLCSLSRPGRYTPGIRIL